jgi:hypothetical protein
MPFPAALAWTSPRTTGGLTDGGIVAGICWAVAEQMSKIAEQTTGIARTNGIGNDEDLARLELVSINVAEFSIVQTPVA